MGILRTSPIVDFKQLLGAAHSKRLLKYAFSLLVQKAEKEEKARNLTQNLAKKLFFRLNPDSGWRLLKAPPANPRTYTFSVL